MTINKPLFLLLIFISAFSVQAQTVDDIISGYITFIGGAQQWQSVHTIKDSGIYNYGGIEFPFISYSKAPNLYKFIVPFKGKYYEQVFNGKTGWKIDAFKGQTKRTLLTGKPALAMANEADVELESPFINYTKKGHQALLEGKDTVGKRECFKIKFTTKSGDNEIYYFDTAGYSLIKKEAVSKNEEMENKILATYYSDYRAVNGVKIPFKSTSKSGDQTILTITIIEAGINVPISDDDFK